MDSTQPLQAASIGQIVQYHHRTDDLELVVMPAMVTGTARHVAFGIRENLEYQTANLAVFGCNGMFFAQDRHQSDSPRVGCWSFRPSEPG